MKVIHHVMEEILLQLADMDWYMDSVYMCDRLLKLNYITRPTAVNTNALSLPGSCTQVFFHSNDGMAGHFEHALKKSIIKMSIAIFYVHSCKLLFAG